MHTFPEINLSGLQPRTAEIIREIDAQATTMARRMLAEGPSVSDLRDRVAAYTAAGTSYDLIETNRQSADLLEQDARRLALLGLRSHDRACCANARHYELSLYEELLREALRLKPILPAAMANIRRNRTAVQPLQVVA